MKKVIFFVCLLAAFVGCSNDDGDESYKGVSPAAKELGLEEIQLSKNANSNEIGFFVTNAGDTILLTGEKDELGNTKEITLLSFVSDNDNILIRFNENKLPETIESKSGVNINLDWLTSTSALVKVFDSNTNTYISTVWYTDSVPEPQSESKSRSVPQTREGKCRMMITPEVTYQSDNIRNRSSRSTPIEEVQDKVCVFSTSQCGVMTDLSTWISLRNAKTGKSIENVYYTKRQSEGVYYYIIPSTSFPAKASNQELCQKIDFALSALEGGCTLLAGISGLTDWIAIACASTGIGAPPAAVLAAITKVAVVGSVSLQVFMAANGTQGLMSTCNPEWYYKEYVAADLELHPYVITKTDVIHCESVILTPDSGPIYIDQDVDGEPTIDNFTLSPAYPSAGQSYVATANFHCVPSGSTIVMNIVGTDGYSNTETHSSDDNSGTVSLYVPGAESGVYDVCTITITTPDGESYSMQASLVFGA